MALVVNKNETNATDLLSGATRVFEVANESRWNPTSYYTSYVQPNREKAIPIDFEKAGNNQGLVFLLRFYWSHFENNTIGQLEIILQEDVGGTWTDRTSGTLRTDEYITPSEKPKMTFHDFVEIEFNVHFPIDTTSGKWRYLLKNTRIAGTDAGYIYYGKCSTSANTEILIPVLDSTKTYDPSQDLLINTKEIDWNENAIIEGTPALSGWHAIGNATRQYAYLNTITKLGQPHPKVTIRPKASETELTITTRGNIHITGSYEKREASWQVGTEDSPIADGKKVYQLLGGHSSTYRGAFSTVYPAGVNAHARYSFFGQAYPTERYRSIMSEPHHRYDTEIKIRGDYTHWEVGDRIQTTFPRYAVAYGYSDQTRQETKRITSISYDVGTDVTTLGIDVELRYEYDYAHYLSDPHGRSVVITENEAPYYVYNIDKTANVFLRAEDGDYAKSATNNHKIDQYSYFRSFVARMQGVLIEDFYRPYHYGGGHTQPADKDSQYFRNVFFVNNYESITFQYQKAKLYIDNCIAFSSELGGTTHLASLSYSRGLEMTNCAGFDASRLLYTAYVNGILLRNNISETTEFHYLASGTSNVLYENNIHRLGAKSYSYRGSGANIKGKNNTYVFIQYHGNYNTGSNYATAIHYINKETANGKADFTGDNILFTHNYVRADIGSSIDLFLKNSNVQETMPNNDKVCEAFDEHLDWAYGMRIAFDNYNSDNKKEVWWTNGKSTSIDVGGGEVKWEIKPFNEDFVMEYRKNSIVLKPNEPISITVGIEIDNENYWAGNHMLPKVKIEGLEMDETTNEAQIEARLGIQYVTVTGIPKNTGFFDIIITTQTDSSDNKVYIYNEYTNPREPRVTSDMDIAYRGDSIDTMIAEKITNFGNWNFDIDTATGANSVLNLVKTMSKVLGWLRSLL